MSERATRKGSCRGRPSQRSEHAHAPAQAAAANAQTPARLVRLFALAAALLVFSTTIFLA